MDPFSALGVASNVIQLVGFISKIFSETYALHNSSSESTLDNAFIERIAKDIRNQSKAIQNIDVCPNELQDLVTDCLSLSSDLINTLGVLKIRGEKTKWKSFLAALRGNWDRGKVKSFLSRIAKLQTQIGSHMQILLLNQQSVTMKAISDLETESRRLKTRDVGTLNALEQLIIKRTENLQISSFDVRTERSPNVQEDDEVAQTSFEKFCDQIAPLIADLRQLETQGKLVNRHNTFLNKLSFPEVHERYQKVKRAHEQTFEWIFERSDLAPSAAKDFRSWLQHGNGTFWIQGKAGSGKSTLMKFLYGNQKTVRDLRVWAGAKTLVTARHFFWKSGTALQKTQEGLLRSLLLEILRNCPSLIPELDRPRPSGNGLDMGYNEDHLMDICVELMELNLDSKFCFFIDGLDEYEGCANDLVGTLERLSQHPHIKICASSRPFTEFLDAYGSNGTRVFKLEAFTKNDISCYVFDTLTNDKRFRALRDREPTALKLVEEVVEKAQGVFLWVFLAVNSLLEGLKYADRIRDMRKRLAQFPRDLEDFFQNMLDSVPQFYRGHTARVFQTALSSQGTLPLMVYSFLDDIDDDPQFAIDLEVQPMTNNLIVSRHDQMRRQLDARCKGLLEVVETTPDSMNYSDDFLTVQVDFLHRTVKDYLDTSQYVRDLFKRQLHPKFDIHLAISQALLALLKSTPNTGTAVSRNSDYCIERIVYFAKVLASNGTSHKSLHSVLSSLDSVFQSLSLIGGAAGIDKHAITKRLIREDFHLYVDQTLSSQPSLMHSTSPALLALALLPAVNRDCENWPSFDMVQTLLNHGADPNQMFEGSSIWYQFLQRLILRNRYESPESTVKNSPKQEQGTETYEFPETGTCDLEPHLLNDNLDQGQKEKACEPSKTGFSSLKSNLPKDNRKQAKATSTSDSAIFKAYGFEKENTQNVPDSEKDSPKLTQFRSDIYHVKALEFTALEDSKLDLKFLEVSEDKFSSGDKGFTDEEHLNTWLRNLGEVRFGPNGDSASVILPPSCLRVVRLLLEKGHADSGVFVDLPIRIGNQEANPIANALFGDNIRMSAKLFLSGAPRFGYKELSGLSLK